MHILLVGINAKFIHSCLAVHTLSQYAAEQYRLDVKTAEYTINQLPDQVLGSIYRRKPDLLGFSVYIWNASYIYELIGNLKKILPETKILLGGPEVTFDPAEALQKGADFVLSGEGEESFSRLCLALQNGTPLEEVPSLTWRDGGTVRTNPTAAPLDLAKLPFVYDDLTPFADRIIYYEAQRGCPFNCQYCLSSTAKGVRFQPLDKVKKELQFFLDHKVRQVKFVDRTFNANPRFAMAIWQYLVAHDNGVTNFHFEMEAALITDEMIPFLQTVRPGLMQFEIGVQSTNPDTLAAVDRRESFSRIAGRVRQLQQNRNIHLHLDLIAGLPYEGYESFGQSFDDVYALSPDQFQLGFLKLLKGSGLRRDRDKYGIVCRDAPPYEVLYTDALAYDELLRLHAIEDLTDSYYNSRRFTASLAYLTGLVEPFAFYEGFAAFYEENGLTGHPPSKTGQYDALYRYGSSLDGADPVRLLWLLKLDFFLRERPGKLPECLRALPDLTGQAKERIYAFYSDPENRERLLPEYGDLPDYKLLARMAAVELFPFDPLSYLAPGGAAAVTETETALLFNYRRTDIFGNAAVQAVTLPAFSRG